jgi:pimeloyl-ACP methyl ester carboxylesterase
MGSGEPVVLLHGILCSEHMWHAVAPLLAGDYDVIAPTALGHNGGPLATAAERPTRLHHVVDAAERQLDELSLQRAHLVGNSMGGWMALELALRGRALSVCALSPAGMWSLQPGAFGASRSRGLLRRSLRMGRATHRALPLLYHSRRIRQFALRGVAERGAAVPRQEALRLTRDMLACTVADDLLGGEGHFAPVQTLPCPVTVAWSEHDKIFPEDKLGSVARERLPGARYLVLPGVGHVPMLDDPQLVAATIRTAAVPAGAPEAAGAQSSP